MDGWMEDGWMGEYIFLCFIFYQILCVQDNSPGVLYCTSIVEMGDKNS